MQGFVLYSHSQVCGDCGGNSQLSRNSLHKLSQERSVGDRVEAEASQQGPWSSRLPGQSHRREVTLGATRGGVRSDARRLVWGPNEWIEVELVRVCRDTASLNTLGQRVCSWRQATSFLWESTGEERDPTVSPEECREDAFKEVTRHLWNGVGGVSRDRASSKSRPNTQGGPDQRAFLVL